MDRRLRHTVDHVDDGDVTRRRHAFLAQNEGMV